MFFFTLNTDLQKRLVNRQLGTVKHNSEHSTDSVIKIHILNLTKRIPDRKG